MTDVAGRVQKLAREMFEETCRKAGVEATDAKWEKFREEFEQEAAEAIQKEQRFTQRLAVRWKVAELVRELNEVLDKYDADLVLDWEDREFKIGVDGEWFTLDATLDVDVDFGGLTYFRFL